MRIAELFHSVQGEGEYTGTPSVFVRTTGCNLRCWFCDTPYTSWQPEGTQYAWQDVVEQVLEFNCEHVVVTGGEPMLQREIVPFTQALGAAGRFVTIETAGTVDRPVYADLISLSPKLANSTPRNSRWADRHDDLRKAPGIAARLMCSYRYQLKFVVDQPEDLQEIDAYVARFPHVDTRAVWLLPQGTTAEELAAKRSWLDAEAALRGWRVSQRLHIELWGNVRGK